MLLETVKIKNFRGYQAETIIPISNLTAFIGKNDVGKSTILEALEIFFNNSLIYCEKNDLNIAADNDKIEISCTFSDFPEELVIDAAKSTTLQAEYLLNAENKLEIKKVFTATIAKPKEKVFIICNHPTINNVNDLLTLKRAELKERAVALNIPTANYNGNINSSIREAIRDSFDDLHIQRTELLVDKEDTKKVFDTLKTYLPIYALFQSDRQSKDDDKEVTDPMKIAVQQALSELSTELEYIKEQVKVKAIDTANRTLAKLKEMSPDLANELIPEFKTEPKFDSQFKLTIKSEEDIPINKRGSGIRRLILLNFFRAEVERLRTQNEGNQIIFAFEEPETSQHPDHQEMLIQAFIELANTGNSQIILTTHTPSLGGLLPLNSLRFIKKSGNTRIIQSGTEDVFEEIASTLGVLADPIPKKAKAILLLEGKSDVTFINHAASELKNNGYINYTFEDKGIALIPIGGCGNLKHWTTLKLIDQFHIPYCILLDSDKGTNEEQNNIDQIRDLRQAGIKAYVTRKREPENYVHMDCLNLQTGSTFSFTDTCDAKTLIANEKSTKKTLILETYWTQMTAEQIRFVETYDDNGSTRYEFTEMFTDFLSIVP